MARPTQKKPEAEIVIVPLNKSVLEILSALKAALKVYTDIKLVFYDYLLLFQTLKSAFVSIVMGQLHLDKVLLK